MKIELTSLRGREAHQSALDDLVAKLQELEAESNGQPYTEAQQAEFDENKEARAYLEAAIEQLRIRETEVAAALKVPGRVEASSVYSAPNVIRTPDNIFDLSAYRAATGGDPDKLAGALRDGAMRVAEKAMFPSSPNTEASRDKLARVIERHKDERFGATSRYVIAGSSPAYQDAWAAKLLRRDVDRSGLGASMMAVMQSYSDGTDGGLALPPTIDPTFVVTSDGSVNPLRQPGWARQETITTKTWQGVTTAGVTASYVGERTTSGAADGAPTDVAGPTATPVRADVSIPVSLEFLQDYGTAALMGQVGGMVNIAKDDLEADQFFMGDGSGAPDGIVAAIVTDTTSIVPTITNDVFALGDIDKLIAALPPRFRARGRMCANLGILQLIPPFGTAGQPGNSIYDAIAKTLRGYPVAEASAMDDVATDAKKILLFGDFSHFVVVDRLGLTTRVLDAYDASGRPTGNQEIYAAWRNTTKPLDFNAFRLLKVQ
jgi:HK97 family phage major capsid protein